MNRIPSKLYHYCSIDSFYHIVKSKSLWLSNSSQMNDSNENIWIEKYFDVIKNFFKDTKYQKLVKESLDIYKWNSNPPFIFCLSGSKDLLSQWRAYSQDGKGISMGFNTKNLKIKRELPTPNVYGHHTIGMAKVEYFSHSQKKKVLELCKMLKNSFDSETEEDEKLFLSLDLGISLVNWALVFKNSSFREEKEWRIIHTPTDSYEEPLAELSDLQFRLNNNRITTYYSYSFGEKFNSELIGEIVLGPKCQMNENEIQEFLNHHNLGKTKISISKSTYR